MLSFVSGLGRRAVHVHVHVHIHLRSLGLKRRGLLKLSLVGVDQCVGGGEIDFVCKSEMVGVGQFGGVIINVFWLLIGRVVQKREICLIGMRRFQI